MKTIIQLVLFVLVSLFAQGQTTTFNLSFNHVALSVKDIERSAAFYRNTLNLTDISTKAQLDAGIRWFSLGEGGALHLLSVFKDTVITNKAVHLALTTNHFEDLVKMLDRQNVNYSDWPGTSKKINIREDGIQQIFFQDPDGYWIEINSVGHK